MTDQYAIYRVNLLTEGKNLWQKSFEQAMSELWSEYLMAAFVQEKYNLKHEEEGHEED